MTAISVASFPRTILVVDDEQVVRDVVARALDDRGWTVVQAVDGESAVEQVKKTGFGCLLVDKNLPGIDGIEVIREARREQPYCAALIMTAYASIESAVEAMQLGANDYLLKPFDDIGIVTMKVEQAMKNAQAHYENAQLMEKIRTMAAKLSSQDDKLSKQGTEIEMFEKVLKFSVDNAVGETSARVQELERELADRRTSMPRVLEGSISLLKRVRAVHRNADVDREALKDTLLQVIRVLEKNIDLLSDAGE